MLKIAGGEHRGRKLKAVPGETTRPTSQLVRQALFNIVGPRRLERVLDCFSGTGALALEALSRGAERAVAVEQAPRAAAAIAENARALGLSDRLEIVRADALRGLALLAEGAPFDLVVADPPYAYDRWEALLPALAAVCRPDGLVAVEHGGDRPLPPCPALTPSKTYRYGGTALTLFTPADLKSRGGP